MRHLKVDGHPGLIRDEKTKAILNTNMNDYQNYLKIKQNKQNENNKIESMENELYNIKNELNEIKDLLKKISNGSK